MMAIIDAERGAYGVEPIGEVLPIAPSNYYERKAREVAPQRAPPRVMRDEAFKVKIQRIWEENFRVYGARKILRQLHREGISAARCTVERLMRVLGIQGVARGRRCKATVPDTRAEALPDQVQRRFTASRPNALWVAELTYGATWRGFAYASFVIDVFGCSLVGWRVDNTLRTDLALDALAQALYQRDCGTGLIHHSDRDTQYAAIHYTDRLPEAGIEASVGSVGDCGRFLRQCPGRDGDRVVQD